MFRYVHDRFVLRKTQEEAEHHDTLIPQSSQHHKGYLDLYSDIQRSLQRDQGNPLQQRKMSIWRIVPGRLKLVHGDVLR